MPPRTPARRRTTLLSFLLVFLLGLFIARLPSTLAQIAGRPDAWTLVSDVRNLVVGNYVDDLNAEKQAKLTKGAIDGMLEALDDPYAEYISAEDAADFEKAMTGSFSGIGCQIDIRDGWLYVVSPIEDSPAFNAGVLAGDRITKVDGTSTQGKTADQCIKMITGPEGTMVHIDIQRAGTGGQDIPMDIKRAKITSKSVRGFRRLSDDTGHWDHLIDPAAQIAYIRMSQFTPTSPKELTEAIAQAEKAAAASGGKAEIGGLILDLRNNPGGLMDAALEISDLFLDSGRIMSTKGRSFPEVVYTADMMPAPAPKYPIAILVNEDSASASEIVAGALSENGRATVIGTRSFGKGLVQSVTGLPHDRKASVKFTTQRYYLPSGKLIQRTDEATEWGVDPTPGFYVPMTTAERIDLVYKRRDWDILRKAGTPLPAGVEDVPPPADQHWSDPAWIESAAKDKQLAGAVKALRARVSTGQWAKLSDEKDQHGKIAATELRALERGQINLAKQAAILEKRIDTLQNGAVTGKSNALPDLWADDLNLTGGMVEVKDKSGKVIADLRITGRDLERWFIFADLEKLDAAKSTDHAKAKPDPSAPVEPKQ